MLRRDPIRFRYVRQLVSSMLVAVCASAGLVRQRWWCRKFSEVTRCQILVAAGCWT